MIDIHAHILPGIDDGAPDWDTSLAMCKMAADDGIDVIVATPHMLDGTYNTTREQIINGVTELDRRLRAAGIDLRILQGGDVHVEANLLPLLRAGELMTINDAGKYLLVEFARSTLPPRPEEFLFSVRSAGITPIVTHPERNLHVARNPEMLATWIRSGALIQVTADSLGGRFGRSAQRLAWSLIRGRFVHVIASDAHHLKDRPPILSYAAEHIAREISAEEAVRLTDINPSAIVAGENVDTPDTDPKALRKRRFWPFR